MRFHLHRSRKNYRVQTIPVVSLKVQRSNVDVISVSSGISRLDTVAPFPSAESADWTPPSSATTNSVMLYIDYFQNLIVHASQIYAFATAYVYLRKVVNSCNANCTSCIIPAYPVQSPSSLASEQFMKSSLSHTIRLTVCEPFIRILS